MPPLLLLLLLLLLPPPLSPPPPPLPLLNPPSGLPGSESHRKFALISKELKISPSPVAVRPSLFPTLSHPRDTLCKISRRRPETIANLDENRRASSLVNARGSESAGSGFF